MIEWIASPMAEHLGWVLVHFVWQGTLVALLFALALAALQRRAPSVRYAAGLIALALLALLPVATWWVLDSPSAAGLPETATESVRLDHLTAAPTSDGMAAAAEAEEHILEEAWTTVRESLQPMLPWFTGIWGLGVIVMSLWTLGGWLVVRRYCRKGVAELEPVWQTRAQALALRMGIGRSFRLLQSDRVEGPITVGTWKPVILLPLSVVSGLPSAQVEALIAHELAHIRRYDYAVNWMQTTLETLLFFHPAVWWISNRVRIERELCCDDLAAEACGDCQVYSRALASAERRRQVTTLALAADGGSLLSRIRRLVAPQEPTPAGNRWAAGIALLAVCAGLVLAGAYLPGPENGTREVPPASTVEVFTWDTSTLLDLLPADTTEAKRDTLDSEPRVQVFFRDDSTTAEAARNRSDWLSFFRSGSDSLSRSRFSADSLLRRFQQGWETDGARRFFAAPSVRLDSLLREERDQVIFVRPDTVVRSFFQGDSTGFRFQFHTDTLRVPSFSDTIQFFRTPSERNEEQDTLRQEMQQLREEMQALQRELQEKSLALQELQQELRSELVERQREELRARMEEERQHARENREHVLEARRQAAEHLRREAARLQEEAEALPDDSDHRARLLELSERLRERAEQIQAQLEDEFQQQ